MREGDFILSYSGEVSFLHVEEAMAEGVGSLAGEIATIVTKQRVNRKWDQAIKQLTF